MCSRYYIDDDTLDEVSGLLTDRKSFGLKWTAENVEDWICDGEQTQVFLQKIPVSLQRTQEYEQQSLFGML